MDRAMPKSSKMSVTRFGLAMESGNVPGDKLASRGGLAARAFIRLYYQSRRVGRGRHDHDTRGGSGRFYSVALVRPRRPRSGPLSVRPRLEGIADDVAARLAPRLMTRTKKVPPSSRARRMGGEQIKPTLRRQQHKQRNRRPNATSKDGSSEAKAATGRRNQRFLRGSMRLERREARECEAVSAVSWVQGRDHNHEYWGNDAVPFELRPAVKERGLAGLAMHGYGGAGGA